LFAKGKKEGTTQHRRRNNDLTKKSRFLSSTPDKKFPALLEKRKNTEKPEPKRRGYILGAQVKEEASTKKTLPHHPSIEDAIKKGKSAP